MEREKVKEIKEALYSWQESVMISIDENYVSHKVYNREILDYINELESENERLNKNNYCLLERNRDLIRACDTCRISLKQFAERLKEKYGKSCSEYYPLLLELTSEQLDETLKEFI